MSLMLPEVNTTKYCVLADRSLVGSIVSVEPDRVRRLLLAASKLSTTVPVAEPERSVILPVPRAIASEKVNAMLPPPVIPVAPPAGKKVETVGAVTSTASAPVGLTPLKPAAVTALPTRSVMVPVSALLEAVARSEVV